MARAFADVVRELGSGSTYDDLTAGLAEVVEAVIATRKAGELTLKMAIKPNGESSVIIVDDVKTKVPKPARGNTIFFATTDGSLIRNDPRQESLPLREVAETKAPLKDFAHG
jgi:hypothetical protein